MHAGELRELEAAFAERQLDLYYQPVFRLRDHMLAGYEAVIRRLHPEKGTIQPEGPITVGEGPGLSAAIGIWGLQCAAAALAQITIVNPSRRADPLFMALNVSEAQWADAGWVNAVREALAFNKLSAAQLRLQIDWTAGLDASESALENAKACAALGVRLVTLQPGSGSLAPLYRLPMHALKLSASTVLDLARYPACSKVVSAVTQLCRELNLQPMAEGIERAHQSVTLRALGIEYGQGPHYGSAMPLMVAARFVQRSYESSFHRPA